MSIRGQFHRLLTFKPHPGELGTLKSLLPALIIVRISVDKTVVPYCRFS